MVFIAKSIHALPESVAAADHQLAGRHGAFQEPDFANSLVVVEIVKGARSRPSFSGPSPTTKKGASGCAWLTSAANSEKRCSPSHSSPRRETVPGIGRSRSRQGSLATPSSTVEEQKRVRSAPFGVTTSLRVSHPSNWTCSRQFSSETAGHVGSGRRPALQLLKRPAEPTRLRRGRLSGSEGHSSGSNERPGRAPESGGLVLPGRAAGRSHGPKPPPASALGARVRLRHRSYKPPPPESRAQ